MTHPDEILMSDVWHCPDVEGWLQTSVIYDLAESNGAHPGLQHMEYIDSDKQWQCKLQTCHIFRYLVDSRYCQLSFLNMDKIIGIRR